MKLWGAKQRLREGLTALFTPTSCRWYDRRNLPYCIASLSLSLWQAAQAFQYGTSRTYMVQDDARQHVFWMQRWLDSELFPNDLIADYFQSVAPWGYQSVYRALSWFSFDPLQSAKILPGIIAFISTLLFFRFILRISPVPVVALLGCIFLNQALWFEDGIISGTPRAFAYPCLIGFLDAFLGGKTQFTVIYMGLAALFYPQALLLAIATLTLPIIRAIVDRIRLAQFKNKQDIDHLRKALFPWLMGLCILGALVIGRSLGDSPDFGPVLSRAAGQGLSELGTVDGEYGRSLFFYPNPIIFWLFAPRSGFLAIGFLNPLLLSSFALPWLLRSPQPSLIIKSLNPQIKRIRYFLGASCLMFVAAHALLFQLHLPARYIYYSFRISLILLGSIATAILLERWWHAGQRWIAHQKWHWVQLSAVFLLIGAIALGWLPLSKGFTVYSHLQIKGRLGDIYEFLQDTPKDTLVASLAKEADNIPTFGQRSVLTASEYAIPYHWGYYRQLRQRFQETIIAQYSDDLTVIGDFLDRYGIDYWLIEPWKLSAEEFQKSTRLRQFDPVSGEVLNGLRSGQEPIFPIFFERCTAVEQKDQRLLDARCMRQIIAELSPTPLP